MNYPNSKYKINNDVFWHIPVYALEDQIKFFFQGKKLIKDWEKIYDIRVLDLDGWDRNDPYLLERYYTSKEFERGISGSTCEFGENSVDYIYKDYWEGILSETNIRSDILQLAMKLVEDWWKIERERWEDYL